MRDQSLILCDTTGGMCLQCERQRRMGGSVVSALT